MKPAWDSDELAVASDGARMARYRRHQSWYREHVLRVPPGEYRDRNGRIRPLGNLLPEDAADHRRWLNFLDEDVATYVHERAQVVVSEGGTLEATRLYRNMLSSMPLCFNLFGALRCKEDQGLEIVRSLFDREATAVEMVECEWTPRRPESSIGDRTAFDAAIVTIRSGGHRHLVAIETKYTEPFSRTRYGARSHDAGRYRSLHDASGWFGSDAYDALTAPSTNQLWRNCLLAATSVDSGEFASAEVVVVSLADDLGARKAVDGVRAHMTDPSQCRAVSLEEVVSTGGHIEVLAEWSDHFEQRYLAVR